MRTIADLHIHSRFSLATSPKLNPASLERWARIKGIDLLGTGDCTHPAWLAELREGLEEGEEGFFRLKEAQRRAFAAGPALAEGLPSPPAPEEGREPRFVLTGEISTIYSRGGKTRKVHHLVVLPSFEAALAFQSRLERVGKISSDGRPILGIDSRDLLSLLLEADDRSILVPAHIWTPWFSALGARSGFDSIEECYRDLSPRIAAIETGLSSNPPMNWAVPSLDRYAIISNSDAHSPDKLGREATILDLEPGFPGLAQALGGGGPSGRILGTLEFFPQEGKYHYDGHRACGVVLDPLESAERGGRCPACGKALTPGVLGRVAELAGGPVDEEAPCPTDHAGSNRRPYTSLVPLVEILGEVLGLGPGSAKVRAAYGSLVERGGSEFSLLLDLGLPELAALGRGLVPGEILATAIGRIRAGEVSISPGYDGEYGVIRAFAPGELPRAGSGLFGEEAAPPAKKVRRKAATLPRGQASVASPAENREKAGPGTFTLDPAQMAVLDHPGGPALVVAGPGSGKTAVVALRIARLIEGGAQPESILALSFTTKAAGELGDRLARSLLEGRLPWSGTFHSFCLGLLREFGAAASLPGDFAVLDPAGREAHLAEAADSPAQAGRLGVYIEARKRFLLLPGEPGLHLGPGAPGDLPALARDFGLPPPDPELEKGYARYRDRLRGAGALDFDDLLAGTARLLAARPPVLEACRERWPRVFVDEYQDLNFAQYALLRILAPREILVIGDPNQAIYGFRGSDPRFLERFGQDNPGAKTYGLSRSFRCPPELLDAAGRLVGRDQGSGPKGADTAASPAAAPGQVELRRSGYPTDRSEAEGIAREIDRLIGGTRFFAQDSGVAGRGQAELGSLGECAILVRAGALIPPLAKALDDHGLPYRLAGEMPWWEEGQAASVLGLLRAATGRLGPAGADPGLAAGLSARLPGLDAPEALDLAWKALEDSGGLAPPGPGREDARLRLAQRARASASLQAFLDALALASPQDGLEARSEAIALMTIHAAKGLEFDRVFVAGLEEGILPFTLYEDRDQPGSGPEGRASLLAEEARLLYVAMTRARLGLHLSWAASRRFKGRLLELQPSSFLGRLEDLFPLVKEGARPRDTQLGLF